MATRALPKLILAAALLAPTVAHAQSTPNLQRGQVPTAGQWNSFFAAKQDVLGFVPVNQAGDTMTGPLITVATSTAAAGVRLPPGTAPTSPVNGDLWTTSAGIFVRVNGVTIGPLGQSLTTGNAGCFVANATGSPAVPACVTLTSALDQAIGTVRGSLVTRGASVWASLSPGAAGGPLVSGGAGADIAYGTRSGNTTAFATAAGVLTNGDCVQFDGSGNIVSAGGPCTTGGGGGTVTAGTINQIAYYATTGTTVSGLATALSVAVGGTNCSVASGTCLDNVAGFNSSGHLVRTGAGAYAFRTLTGTASHLAVTNGSGVGGNPTIDFASAVIFTGAFGTWTYDANSMFIRDQSDNTKRGQFDASAIGTGQTRSYKLPNANGTIAVSASAGVSLDPATGNITPDAATNSEVWSATGGNKLVTAAVINTAGQSVALTDAATIALNMAAGINFSVILGGNRTLGAPTGIQVGRSGCIVVAQDGTGNRTLAYNTIWKFSQGIPPILSTAPGSNDLLCYYVATASFIIATMTLGVQ